MNAETQPPGIQDEAPSQKSRRTQTDIMNIPGLMKATGLSRPVIRRAIEEGELKSFYYARQYCVLRTEYLRWLNSLQEQGEQSAAS